MIQYVLRLKTNYSIAPVGARFAAFSLGYVWENTAENITPYLNNAYSLAPQNFWETKIHIQLKYFYNQNGKTFFDLTDNGKQLDIYFADFNPEFLKRIVTRMKEFPAFLKINEVGVPADFDILSFGLFKQRIIETFIYKPL